MRVTVVNGYRVELDLIDHIQRMVYLGAYERWETGVVRRLLRPGMCFVDVGANKGTSPCSPPAESARPGGFSRSNRALTRPTD